MQSDLVLHNGPFECTVCLCTYDNNGVVLRDCLHVFCRYENTISLFSLYLSHTPISKSGLYLNIYVQVYILNMLHYLFYFIKLFYSVINAYYIIYTIIGKPVIRIIDPHISVLVYQSTQHFCAQAVVLDSQTFRKMYMFSGYV